MSTAPLLRPNAPSAAPSTLKVEEVDGVSLPSRVLSESLRHTVKPFLDTWARHPQLPWPSGLVDYLGTSLMPRRGTRRDTITLPQASAELLTPPSHAHSADGSTESARAILYLHGGAFICCGIRSHRQMVSRIAAASGAQILNVGYRMIPHSPLTSAIDDG
ncbi:MAG: alpha/beta hydrolase, partial [Rhodococcus sp.]|nr:alpha/beta hydrolase [Rhodococcus sp. (in: high G+C Gram-positive bacteria)]